MWISGKLYHAGLLTWNFPRVIRRQSRLLKIIFRLVQVKCILVNFNHFIKMQSYLKLWKIISPWLLISGKQQQRSQLENDQTFVSSHVFWAGFIFWNEAISQHFNSQILIKSFLLLKCCKKRKVKIWEISLFRHQLFAPIPSFEHFIAG